MKPTPFQRVKAEFESKNKLVDKIAGKLNKKKDESESALKKRLLKVSSKKLLALHQRVITDKK